MIFDIRPVEEENENEYIVAKSDAKHKKWYDNYYEIKLCLTKHKSYPVVRKEKKKNGMNEIDVYSIKDDLGNNLYFYDGQLIDKTMTQAEFKLYDFFCTLEELRDLKIDMLI